MTSRQLRRAAERQARKQAQRQAAVTSATPVQSPEQSDGSTISEAQLAANRANAQLSTGPRTAEGKAKISLNAVKTGLTGQTVLLPSEDAEKYEAHVRAYHEELKPVGHRESDLVQAIADCAWRLARIPALEIGLYTKGRLEFAECTAQFNPAYLPALLDLHTEEFYEKQLRNLRLQEARLHRRREKDLAELRQIQAERKAEEKKQREEALEAAAKQYVIAKAEHREPENGFEFSNEQIEEFLNRMSPAWHSRVLAACAPKQAQAA